MPYASVHLSPARTGLLNSIAGGVVMSRLLPLFIILAVVLLAGGECRAQTEDQSSTDGDNALQSALDLFGSIPLSSLNNVSGVSAPSIAIGSGATSTASSLSGLVSPLFSPSSSVLDLTAGASGQTSLGSWATTTGGLSQAFSSQSLNLAQSFSSSVQNILAPMMSGASGASGTSGLEGFGGLQTSTQNNLSATQPVTALQGSASSVNTTTNNGFTLSLSGFSFNFGR
jgi:hypothetical protein